MIRSSLLAVLVCALIATRPSVAPAQSGDCVGACEGLGRVTVVDVVLLINIALGLAPLAACPSGLAGATNVDVSLIVNAINNVLNGCPVNPTPTASPSPTPTMQVVPNVAGNWTERRPTLNSSTCNSATRQLLEEALAAAPRSCRYQVSQQGNRVHAVDCDDEPYDGTVDGTGVATFPQLYSESAEGCTLSLSGNLVVDLSRNPTTATYSIDVTFTGSCFPLANCTAEITSEWSRS